MRKSSWWSATTFMGLLLFFSTLSWGQTSSLEGDVKDENGNPYPNVWIKIERKDIKGNYQVKTNKKGHYFHAGLPLGTYKLSLEVDGKIVDSVDGVRTKFSETETVNFNMADVKNRQAALNAGMSLSQEQARQMTPEQRRQIEEGTKKRQEQLSKNKGLNDAFNAGMDAMRAKNWESAIEHFSKGAEIDSKQHVLFGQMAEAYSNLASGKPLNEQQVLLAKALDSFTKALELKPEDAAYHNNYGLALSRMGKYTEGQAELGKAAQLDPTNAGRYYFNLGAILVNTGHNDEAYEAFKKAITADPNYADAHFQIGLYLMSKAQVSAEGKITPAPGTADAFQKYIELKPNGPYAESAKGSLQALAASVQTEITTKPQKKSSKK